MNEPLIFDIALGRTKPVNMRDASVRCPFCDRSKLTDILAQDGHIIGYMAYGYYRNRRRSRGIIYPLSRRSNTYYSIWHG